MAAASSSGDGRVPDWLAAYQPACASRGDSSDSEGVLQSAREATAAACDHHEQSQDPDQQVVVEGGAAGGAIHVEPARPERAANPQASGHQVATSPGRRGSEGDADNSTQPTATSSQPTAAELSLPANQIPVMLPEKLTNQRAIVEVETREGAAALDLTGDSGVVGRWLVQGQGDAAQLSLDLKGVVYGVKVLPCATTLCLINLKTAEARVEALATQYLQLHEDPRWSEAGMPSGAPNIIGGADDDDDVYQVEDSPAAEGRAAKAGAKRKQEGGGGAIGGVRPAMASKALPTAKRKKSNTKAAAKKPRAKKARK